MYENEAEAPCRRARALPLGVGGGLSRDTLSAMWTERNGRAASGRPGHQRAGEAIFAVLVDPAQQAAIDATGWARATLGKSSRAELPEQAVGGNDSNGHRWRNMPP